MTPLYAVIALLTFKRGRNNLLAIIYMSSPVLLTQLLDKLNYACHGNIEIFVGTNRLSCLPIKT